jgi:hypothetical protein
MTKIYVQTLSLFFLTITLFFGAVRPVSALYDPLSKPNNFYGMHVLFDSELGETAELVNSNGGEWGYIMVPIQMGDYDLEKWQGFMNSASEKKMIPIVRLMTDPYWANTNVWRKPNTSDLIDMANFLNSLNWPIENRYIIVFNEMNRYDEWGGGAPNPEEYVDILSKTVDIFKERSGDFYMIMGGLDNAAPDDGTKHMSVFTYLERMAQHNPDAFKKIDGFSSHSYPNPGFEQPPSQDAVMGTSTYKFEYEFISQVAGAPKPAFITETGWDNTKVSQETIAAYYKESFETIWGNDRDKIVAITPFLLRSHGGFDQFAFVVNDQKTRYYDTVKELKKIKGEPQIKLTPAIGGVQTELLASTLTNSNIAEDEVVGVEGMHGVVKFYFKTLFGF